jgi:DNA gyrase inhibitor GyrI
MPPLAPGRTSEIEAVARMQRVIRRQLVEAAKDPHDAPILERVLENLPPDPEEAIRP